MCVASPWRLYPNTTPTTKKSLQKNNKQRFAISPDGTRIRANQGHSVADVDLNLTSLESVHDTAPMQLLARVVSG
ncbi:MAG: RNA 2'-phosphotransferase [Pirellulaceae bacterium]|nr:RNA 2'-phosphotransferase [Pirellulaceae bacterium]